MTAGRLVLACCSALVALLAVEAAYRLVIERGNAWPRFHPLPLAQPIVVEPDPTLGWRNRPGVHRMTFEAGKRQYAVTATVGEYGERLARRPRQANAGDRSEVAVVGCSFTYGWGVDDDDTYAALAARKRRDLRFVNLASPGYGTYQSLLILRRHYAARPPPRLVVYGVADHHAERNVATLRWQYMLWVFSARGTVAMPYVRLGADGSLVPYPPTAFAFPGLVRPSHALSRFWLWAALRLDPAPAQQDQATRALLTELRDWTAAHGATLVVAGLDGRTSAWRDHLRGDGVAWVQARPYRTLPYDTHPDWAFHRDVAARLVRAVPRVPGGQSAAPSPR